MLKDSGRSRLRPPIQERTSSPKPEPGTSASLEGGLPCPLSTMAPGDAGAVPTLWMVAAGAVAGTVRRSRIVPKIFQHGPPPGSAIAASSSCLRPSSVRGGRSWTPPRLALVGDSTSVPAVLASDRPALWPPPFSHFPEPSWSPAQFSPRSRSLRRSLLVKPPPRCRPFMPGEVAASPRRSATRSPPQALPVGLLPFTPYVPPGRARSRLTMSAIGHFRRVP